MVTFKVNEEGTFLGSYLTDDSFNYIKMELREYVDDMHFSIVNCSLTSFLFAALEIKLYLFVLFIIVLSSDEILSLPLACQKDL